MIMFHVDVRWVGIAITVSVVMSPVGHSVWRWLSDHIKGLFPKKGSSLSQRFFLRFDHSSRKGNKVMLVVQTEKTGGVPPCRGCAELLKKIRPALGCEHLDVPDSLKCAVPPPSLTEVDANLSS